VPTCAALAPKASAAATPRPSARPPVTMTGGGSTAKAGRIRCAACSTRVDGTSKKIAAEILKKFEVRSTEPEALGLGADFALQYHTQHATGSYCDRGSSSAGRTALAMALQARVRASPGRHSHRNSEPRFLLSDHDLHDRIYRSVAHHLVYPPLVRRDVLRVAHFVRNAECPAGVYSCFLPISGELRDS
jgi:hypothetical protein